MKTDIPIGTIVKTKRYWQWEYWRVIDISNAKPCRGCPLPEKDDKGITMFPPISDEEKKRAIKVHWTDNGTKMVVSET